MNLQEALHHFNQYSDEELRTQLTCSKEDVLTNADALFIADLHGMTEEVQKCLDEGLSPIDALNEWDILPNMSLFDYDGQ